MGTPDALPHNGGKTALLAQPVGDRRRFLLTRRNDMTPAALCPQSAQEYQTRVSVVTMGRLSQQLGLPHKKDALRCGTQHAPRPPSADVYGEHIAGVDL